MWLVEYPLVHPDFQRELGFKSAQLNFPKVVCLNSVHGP